MLHLWFVKQRQAHILLIEWWSRRLETRKHGLSAWDIPCLALRLWLSVLLARVGRLPGQIEAAALRLLRRADRVVSVQGVLYAAALKQGARDILATVDAPDGGHGRSLESKALACRRGFPRFSVLSIWVDTERSYAAWRLSQVATGQRV